MNVDDLRKKRPIYSGVARDGEVVTVNLWAMDGATVEDRQLGAVGHRPGGLLVTDADRQRRRALHDAADFKLSERWKNPVNADPKPPVTMADKYAARDQRLSQRWRS